MLIICILLFFFNSSSCFLRRTPGWTCKDNNDRPVDWWYLFKPPVSSPDGMSGLNFSYVTGDQNDQWQLFDGTIDDLNMLRYTVVPYYVPNDHTMAFLRLEQPLTGSLSRRTAAQAFFIAEESGGVYIGHTVPGFPDATNYRLPFPRPALYDGHLMWCISLDLDTLNEIAAVLSRTGMLKTVAQVPDHMAGALRSWLDYPSPPNLLLMPGPSTRLDFGSRIDTLQAQLMFRPPGNRECLYKKFAQRNRIVLDVYSPDINTRQNVCQETFAVRKIDSLCFKTREYVLYVNNSTDLSRFAVSTAASWQETGSSDPQYWTCTSNLPAGDVTGTGGYLFCVFNYRVWIRFDNLKVKEPVC